MFPISILGLLIALGIIALSIALRKFFLIIPGAYAALTADRITETKLTGLKSYPILTATKIYAGSLVAIDSAGYAKPAADAASLKVVGVSTEQVDNTGASGDKSIKVDAPILARFNASSITQAMVGQVMYVVDDNTFDDGAGTNGITAGVLVEFISTTEGWLLIGVETIPNITRTAAQVNLLTQGVASGYKIARGVQTTVAASDDVVTSLATVVAVVATLGDDPVAGMQFVTATIGDQAGAPAAGSIRIKGWKATATADTALIAATTFSKKVNWVAIGT